MNVSANKYVIFDFDGTIADTVELAITIFNRMASDYGLPQIAGEERAMLHGTKPQAILKKYGVSNYKLGLILLRLRKELKKHIAELQPIAGVVEAIQTLKDSGYRLGILTSNSKENVKDFLKNNRMIGLFDFVYSGKSIFGKSSVLERLFEQEKISKNLVVYVGDETRDVEATKKTGIPIVSVTWGLNNRAVLASLSPEQMADTPEELPVCVGTAFK